MCMADWRGEFYPAARIINSICEQYTSAQFLTPIILDAKSEKINSLGTTNSFLFKAETFSLVFQVLHTKLLMLEKSFEYK